MAKKTVIFLLVFLSAQWAAACELTMGYRVNAKPPFIAEMPDNSGLYMDIYTEASKRIGCKLSVVRQPKGRIMRMIAMGSIDFYPGLSFTEKRMEFVTFIPNGLKDGNIGITRSDEKEIFSLHEVAERDMTMVVSFGSFDHNAAEYGINLRTPYDFGLSDMVDLILNMKADFHAYNLLAVEYFLKNNPEKAKFLKIHRFCCELAFDMYLAFSKNSPHIDLLPNPNYISVQPLFPPNLPHIPAPKSTAGKLAQALADMKKDGSFNRIYSKYFAVDGSGG